MPSHEKLTDAGVLLVQIDDFGRPRDAARKWYSTVQSQGADFAGRTPRASLTADGLILAYSSVGAAYSGVKSLVRLWLSSQSLEDAPAIGSVRFVLTGGDLEVSTLFASSKFLGPAAVDVEMLARGARNNSLLVSDKALMRLSELRGVEGVRQPGSYRLYNPQGGVVSSSGTFYSLELMAGRGKVFVSIEVPDDLLKHLAEDPQRLYSLTPRKFEEAMAELFTKLGFTTELTKQTRDGGVDIFAIRRDSRLAISEKYIIQAKRYAPKRAVGVAAVRELVGVGTTDPATGLMIVTTSRFSKPARVYAGDNHLKWRLHLKDYQDIKAWLEPHKSK